MTFDTDIQGVPQTGLPQQLGHKKYIVAIYLIQTYADMDSIFTTREQSCHRVNNMRDYLKQAQPISKAKPLEAVSTTALNDHSRG